jgi:hypothetical protein
MMELSAPYLKKATQYVNKQVGLTDELFKKAWKIIEVELQRENNLTKEDLMDRLAKKNIYVVNLMATQILIRAELEMRLCSGVREKTKVTYSLFDSRVPPPSEKIAKKDSLVKLAAIYFNARGPATVKDFTWWSGLNVADAKFGISGLGKKLKSASIEGLDYLYFEENNDYSNKRTSALLPCYDEYMVGYSEGRNIALTPHIDKSFLGNGVFKPIVLADNAIVGTWKKINKEPFVEIQFHQEKKYTSIKSKLEAFKFFLRKQEE